MTDRYVIGHVHGNGRTVSAHPVLDLPDAEHVHVTIHPDGTITAVPMVRVAYIGGDRLMYDADFVALQKGPLWVDATKETP